MVVWMERRRGLDRAKSRKTAVGRQYHWKSEDYLCYGRDFEPSRRSYFSARMPRCVFGLLGEEEQIKEMQTGISIPAECQEMIQARMRTKTQKSGESDTVCFRLDDENHRLLCERAVALGLKSKHELAKSFTLVMLNEEDLRSAMKRELLAFNQQMHEMRRDFALMVEALLVSAGRVSEEDAKAYVAENFPE